MGRLNGKVAVVTGASKGIGAAIAKRFAAEGASVVVNYASSREGADRVVSEITAAGGKAVAVGGNVAKAADVAKVFEETKKAFGPVDVLVNNAGVYAFQPVLELTEDEFHREFDINVLGPLLATREGVKHFSPNGGSIINVSSVISEKPLPNASIYAGTKGALDAITRILAQELGPKRIRVNTIAPGAVETEGSRDLGVVGGDFEKVLIGRTPLGRLGQPDDIAGLALFLATDDARWVTGERISAAGGYQ